MSRPCVGLLGLGAFGGFLARHLGRDVDLVATDRRALAPRAASLGVRWGDLAEVASQPHLILAVPVQNMAEAVTAALPYLHPRARVYEVASVKVRPLELLDRLLPERTALLGLHPMFGPQSGRDGIVGLKVVECVPSGGRRAAAPRAVRRYLERRLRLQVLPMTAAAHDREMAYIQGLTHWIAKALREIELPSPALATVAYEHMLKIEEILRDDSDELFFTIQRENPYGRLARRDLLRRLTEIDDWIAGTASDAPGEH